MFFRYINQHTIVFSILLSFITQHSSSETHSSLTFKIKQAGTLESQLLEEPFVLAGLVTFFELNTDLEASLLTLNRILQVLGGIFVIEAHVRNAVASGHQVVVVQHLDERLYLGTLVDAGLVHASRHPSWVAVYAGNESMSELLVGGTIIKGLKDDGLAAGVPSTEDEHDLASFHNLAHDGRKNLLR